MGRIGIMVSTLLLVGVLASVGKAQEEDAVLGCWLTESGDSCVEIYRHGEKYFARIVGVREPSFAEGEVEGMDGKPRVDILNPDPSLRFRSLIGLELMTDFEYQGDSAWQKGRIYDPQDGKTYKCNVILQEDGTLKVRGFIGFSLFGRTTIWMRPETYSTESGEPLGYPCPCSQPEEEATE